MKLRQFLLVVVISLTFGVPHADSHSIARGPIKDMFDEADVVAYVQIMEGHVASSGYAVYTSTVVESFKGVAQGDAIVLGPYRGYAVGLEYLAFLKRPTERESTGEAGQPRESEPSDLGPYNRILTEGLGMMDFSYVVEYQEYGVNVASGALIPKELRRGAVRGYVNKKSLSIYLRSLTANDIGGPAPN